MMKRFLDFILSLITLVVSLPVLLPLWGLIRLQMGSPVFFLQERPGRNGVGFMLYKFRTMSNRRGPDGELLPDSERLTALGRWMRKFSLDELPQLLNVLKGDMSLVGPRPLLMEYLHLYSPDQARRHDVRPGITGWAQINGRNALSWDEKFKLDVWYVEHRSLWLDLRILALTAKKVLVREGVNAEGHVTMPKFTGSKEAGDG